MFVLVGLVGLLFFVWEVLSYYAIQHVQLIVLGLQPNEVPSKPTSRLYCPSAKQIDVLLKRNELPQSDNVYESAGIAAGFCFWRAWYWLHNIPLSANLLIYIGNGVVACDYIVVRNRNLLPPTIKPFSLALDTC